MEKDLFIGVDASTTGCKAIVWDLDGNPVGQGRSSIPMLKPRPDWHEQEAGDWWSALAHSLRIAVEEVDLRRLGGICICPQRETFVPTDRLGNPLRNAILWMDGRARELLPVLEGKIGRQRFHEITGKPLSGNLTVLKILWLRIFEPHIFEQTSKFLDVAAYLNYHLTGEFSTGWGIADPAGLFDMRENNWSAAVLDFLGLTPEHLPVVLPTGAWIGGVTAPAARSCGLPEGLPVYTGLGDGQAGGLGVGTSKPGACYLSLGTSVVSGTYTDTYIVDPAFRTLTAGLPGAYSLETVILGGTYTIDWFRSHFARGVPLDQLEDGIKDLPPGSEGLMLVPYWNSALNPYWDPAASGLVIGWRGHHTAHHLYRAILEGIAYELRLHLEGVAKSLNHEIDPLVVMGGGSQSDLWCQMIADVSGLTVHRTETSEATALGAGIIAARGAGIFDDFSAAAAEMQGDLRDHFPADPVQHSRYSRLFREVYLGLFPAVQPLAARLTEITAED